jgi:ribonuclease HI
MFSMAINQNASALKSGTSSFPSNPVDFSFAQAFPTLYFDGGSYGNPGLGTYGFVIEDAKGKTLTEQGGRFGDEVTCNEAEYGALILALKTALDQGLETIEVRGDSEIVLKQISHEYDTNKPTLRKARDTAKHLLLKFVDYRLKHIRRAENSHADRLAAQAAAVELGDARSNR